MKQLKNESTNYMNNISTAVRTCYENGQPANTALMRLYVYIGEQIVCQGEKAFIPHVAEMLMTEFPHLSGYSLRNLRRMRDFYLAYQDEPKLMKQALNLSWTQNITIMEYCGTKEQRAFYIQLAIDQNLSKLKLIEAIACKTYETTQILGSDIEAVSPVVALVSDFILEEATKTWVALKAKREPLVGAVWRGVIIIAGQTCKIA